MATHTPHRQPPLKQKAKKTSKAQAVKSAQKAGSRKPALTKTCPLANPNTIPCDIVDLVLDVEIADSPDLLKNAKADAEMKRVLSRFGTKGKTDHENRMEVVTFRESDLNKTGIIAEVVNFASHGAAHPALSFSQAGQTPKHWYGAGATASARTEVFTAPWFVTGTGLPFDTFWNFQCRPVRSIYTVDTCGIRKSGKIAGGTKLTVDAYPGDEYLFEFTTKPWIEKDKGKEAANWHGLKPANKPPEPKFVFKRNDQDIVEGATIKELLEGFLWFNQILKGIQDLFDELPKSGVLFTCKSDFFAGNFSLRWGWKQDEGFRVYYNVTGSAALVLVSLDLSIGVGFDWKLLVCKLEVGTDEPTEVKLIESFSYKYRAEKVWENRIAAKIDIPLVCRGVASAGYGWFAFKLEAGFKSGFEGEGGISFKPGSSQWFADLKWTGLVGYYTTGTPTRADSETGKQLIQASQLIDWKKPE